MEENPLTIQLESPKDIWHKPITVNPGKLLGAVARGAGYAGAALLNPQPPPDLWADAYAEGVNVLDAFGLAEDTPPQRAWTLVQRGLLRASLQVIRESVGIILRTSEGAFRNTFNAGIDELMREETITIALDFFQRPRELPLLAEYQDAFHAWLVANGIEQQTAGVIAQRLPSYFVYELHREWSDHSTHYQAVRETLETPFTEAVQREYDWKRYAAWLQKQVAEPIFDEPFSLEQIFIGPRAYYVEKTHEAKLPDEPGKQQEQHFVIDLMPYLDRWRQTQHQHEALLTLCGGPGSGKSSIAKLFAAQAAAQGVHLLYIPLHRFDPRGVLIAAIGEYLQQQTKMFSYNPLDGREGDEGLLLIFDGLDELAAQGRIAREVVAEFLHAVEGLVSNRNNGIVTLRVLLCGRDVAVQDNNITLQRAGKVLHLLPYTRVRGKEYRGDTEIMEQDQRVAWWARYGTLTAAGYTALPDELRRADLDDITAQPLLNYLLAATYRHGKLDISSTISLNTIYATLLKHIYQRDYAGQSHQAVRNIDSDVKFAQILEEIALAIWHGNGRTATEQYILERMSDRKKHLLASIWREATTGVSQMMLAFYFRQSGNYESHPTFEFTHKSFGEYLVACRIVCALREVEAGMQPRDEFDLATWDEKKALEHWARVCGPMTLDQHIVTFLRGEVALHPDKVAGWQEMLAGLINHLLRHGMPMEELQLPTFHLANRQARNAEEALLVMLNACARVVSKRATDIAWPQPTSVGDWLARLKGQRDNRKTYNIALDSLSWLNMADQCLIGAEMFRANLYGTILCGTNLNDAGLSGTDLTEADLTGADLARANLTEAHLFWADLTRADLPGAQLTRANLTGALLPGAKLTGADLTGANLAGADLTGAKLTGARLTKAHLTGAYLTRADLTGADLAGADLTGADLTGADLSGTHLTEADLRKANLYATKFNETRTSGAHFDRKQLTQAGINNIDFSKAIIHEDDVDLDDIV